MLESAPTCAGLPGRAQVTPALLVSLVTVAVSTSVPPCCSWALLVELLKVTPAVVPTGPVGVVCDPLPPQADRAAVSAARAQARTMRPSGAQAETLKSALLSRVWSSRQGRAGRVA